MISPGRINNFLHTNSFGNLNKTKDEEMPWLAAKVGETSNAMESQELLHNEYDHRSQGWI